MGQQSFLDLARFDQRRLKTRRRIRDMPVKEQPASRLKDVGAEAMNAAELLSLIINEPEALDTASDILSHIGGLERLPLQTYAELIRFPGISTQASLGLVAACELARRMFYGELKHMERIETTLDVVNLVAGKAINAPQETMRLVLLTVRNEVIAISDIYSGTLDEMPVRIAELFTCAMRYNAAQMILCHNHPSGDPTPSKQDIVVTQQIVHAGFLLDIPVTDHIIIGQNRYISMKDEGIVSFDN